MKPIPLAQKDFITRREERLQFLLKVVSLLAATVSILLAVPLAFRQPSPAIPGGTQGPQVTQSEVSAIRAEIAQIRQALAAAPRPQSTASGPPATDAVAQQIAQTQASVQALAARLEKMEGAILASPAKALEIPLLQRDVENLRSTQANAIAAVKDGVDRLYDINKWLLGAMAVSVITLALSNFLRPKEGASKSGAQ